jgi:glycosyltransferase involved in cell wall biosynthesis
MAFDLDLVLNAFHNPASRMPSLKDEKMTISAETSLPVEFDSLLDHLDENPEDRARLLRRMLGDGPCRQLGIYPLPESFLLSVVIPVFNERNWVGELVRRVQAVPIRKEIILIDDGSTDGTRDILLALRDVHENVRVFLQPENRGKGAVLRVGFQHATGDVIVVQDADLEYDPSEYARMLQPIIENRADVVFGSRFIGESHRVLYFWHSIANRVLTTLSNMFTNLNLTDMETCYKVFRREVVQNMKLRSNRFGFEPEFTAKVARRRAKPWRVYEMPISYSGRTYEEGKKIGLKDAFSALFCIFRYWLWD